MPTDCASPPAIETSAPISKWKRGRPVYSYTRRRTCDTMPSSTASGSCMLDQPTQVKVKRLSDGHACPEVSRSDDDEKVVRDAMQRLSLYDRSSALRFSPTMPMKANRSTDLAGGSMDTRIEDVVLYESSGLVDVEGNVVEESVHLSYNIPEDVLRSAMSASPNTRNNYWGIQLYRGPNEEKVKVHYCSNMATAEKVAEYFMREKVLGFDIEWKPQGNPNFIKHNVSLIQLACEDRIALFHIALYPGRTAEELLPPKVKKILESPEIIKAGVAVKGDFTRLSNYLGVKPQGVFELSRLHNLVEWYEKDPQKVTKKLTRLAVQVHQHLQLPLYKGEQLIDEDISSNVRESDWSQELDHAQIHYAAADVYAGFRLYHVLERKRKQLRPIPPAIALCDYDDKPSVKPRVVKERKRKKVAAQSSSTKLEEDLTPRTSTNIDEEVEDNEDYETAQEDLVDSHDLEHHESPSSQSSEQVEQFEVRSEAHLDSTARQLHATVGRIDLQKSCGPDPEYPELPLTDSSDDIPIISQHIDVQPNILVHVVTAQDDSRYSDSDIDEALSSWIEHDGQLHEDITPNASTLEVSASQGEVQAEEDAQVHNASLSNEQSQNVPDSPHAPQYILATAWAKEYLASTIPTPTSTSPPRLHATIALLRAYHLWHHQSLNLFEIQVCLRDPPLAHSTVASYILQAVSLEHLEYDEEALRAVLMSMQAGFRKGKFRGLAQKLGCP